MDVSLREALDHAPSDGFFKSLIFLSYSFHFFLLTNIIRQGRHHNPYLIRSSTEQKTRTYTKELAEKTYVRLYWVRDSTWLIIAPAQVEGF